MDERKTLLIVDDGEASIAAISSFLSDSFDILSARDNGEATDVINQNGAGLSIILLDVGPKKLNGLSLLRWLSQSRFQDIPVIALAASDSCGIEALQSGAWDYVSAPVQKEILTARVHNVLGRSAFEKEKHTAQALKNQQQVFDAQAELKKSHQKMQEALNRYQALVNTVPGGIALYEIQGSKVITTYYSDGMCMLSGYQRHERDAICRENAMALTYEEDVPALSKAISDAVAQKSSIDFTYRINTKSGVPKWVNLRATYVPQRSGVPSFHAVFSDVDAVKRYEQESKEAQLRYETAIKSSGLSIWEYDIVQDTLNVVANSPRMKQDCMTIPNYVASTVNNGYVRNDSLTAFYGIFERLRRGEKEVTEDIWYKTNDEAGWWCERVIYTTVFDSKGRPYKAFGAGRDVTREKDAEKKFQEEMTYRSALQFSTLASLKINLTTNRIIDGQASFDCIKALIAQGDADNYFHQTLAAVTGTKNKAVYRNTFTRKALMSQFNSGEYFAAAEVTRLFDTQKIYWLKYTAHLMKNPATGDIVAFIVAQDITDEKVMKIIMETISKTDYDFFVVVDGTTNSAVDYTISAGKRLFLGNEPFEETNEDYIRRVVCPEDVERVLSACKITNVLKSTMDGEVCKLDFNMRLENGEIRRKQLQLTLINQARKTFLMTRIDVNSVYIEQKKSQIKLEQALQAAEQASRVKTEFLAKMSHDIRTPMNAIIGMTKLAQNEQNPQATQEYLSNIDTSSHFLLGLINDILDFSKIENAGMELHEEQFTLEEFERNLDTVIRPLMDAKHIEFDVRLNSQIHCMLVDKLRYQQIYFNLLSNAVKYTNEGGRVEFVSERMKGRDDLQGIRCYVRDNGVGMSKEFLHHIFEPFSQERSSAQAAQPGTGLGLAIVKNLVETMGGSIRVSSEIGRGTEFIIEMFVREISPLECVKKVKPEINNLMNRRLLLVEDNELNVIVAKRLLERKGCVIDVALNGRLAVEAFAASPLGYYDAILMDVRMPVMGGLEATKKIRALVRTDAKTTPIIAMTADAFVEDQNKTQEAGMNAHLSKPIEPQTLYETVARLIQNNDA